MADPNDFELENARRLAKAQRLGTRAALAPGMFDKTVTDVNDGLTGLKNPLKSFTDALGVLTRGGSLFEKTLGDMNKRMVASAGLHHDLAKTIVDGTRDLAKKNKDFAEGMGASMTNMSHFSNSLKGLSDVVKEKADAVRKSQDALAKHTADMPARTNTKKYAAWADKYKTLKSSADNAEMMNDDLIAEHVAAVKRTRAVIRDDASPYAEQFRQTMGKEAYESLNHDDLGNIKNVEMLGKAAKGSASTIDLHQKAINNEIQALGMAKGAISSATATITSALLSVAGALYKAGGMTVDNWNAQLKYNVLGSHYKQAAMNGMTDAQMSHMLGTNQQAIGMLTSGQKDLSTHQLNEMGKVGRFMGLTGEEARQKVLTYRADISQTGSRASLDEMAKYAKDQKTMAAGLRMTTEELDAFNKSLSDSGTMAEMSFSMTKKSDDERLEAYRKDINAILYHGRMMGFSADAVKRQMEAGKDNPFRGLADSILGRVHARLETAGVAAMGITVPKDFDRLNREKAEFGNMMNADDLGKLTNEKLDLSTQITKKMQEAAARGDSAMMDKLRIYRQLGGTEEGSVLGTDATKAAIQANATKSSTVGIANDLFGKSATSIMEGMYKTVEQTPIDKAAGAMDAYSTALGVFTENALQRGRELSNGLSGNPVGSMLGSFGQTALNIVAYKAIEKIGPSLIARGAGLLGIGGSGAAAGTAGMEAGLFGSGAGITGTAGMAASIGSLVASTAVLTGTAIASYKATDAIYHSKTMSSGTAGEIETHVGPLGFLAVMQDASDKLADFNGTGVNGKGSETTEARDERWKKLGVVGMDGNGKWIYANHDASMTKPSSTPLTSTTTKDQDDQTKAGMDTLKQIADTLEKMFGVNSDSTSMMNTLLGFVSNFTDMHKRNAAQAKIDAQVQGLVTAAAIRVKNLEDMI
jgi:hypothetical protein